MTGYGRGEGALDDFRFIVEIKAVNHRHLDLVVRAPRELFPMEEMIRRFIKEKISRGRVEVFVTLEMPHGKGKNVNIDEDLAVSYFQCLQKLQTLFNLQQKEVTPQELALFPEVLYLEKNNVEVEPLAPVLEKALSEAISRLLQQRLEEGGRLAKDIMARLTALEGLADKIKERGPNFLEEYRNKLNARLEELHGGKEFDRQRFFTEVAFLAERCNIDEEVVRLKSHLKSFRGEIEAGGVVGRKLDFLLQEMYREINTIASKSNDLEISYLVVEAKSEVEKIREQVQNIE